MLLCQTSIPFSSHAYGSSNSKFYSSLNSGPKFNQFRPVSDTFVSTQKNVAFTAYKPRLNMERCRQFVDYSMQPDYPKKLKALLRGLSKKDRALVSQIIDRMLHPETHKFSQQELKVIDAFEKFKAKGRSKYNLGPISNSTNINLFCDMGLKHIPDLKSIQNKAVIDAGAYIGDTTLILAEHVGKGGKVFAFEPYPKNFAELNKNIKNNLPNDNRIVPVPYALGDSVGEATLFVYEGHPAASTLGLDLAAHHDMLKPNGKIKTTTLDNFAKSIDLPIGMIKTDVEGFEQNLLKGSVETIKKDKPILFISIYHNPSDFFEIKPWAEKLGYNSFKVVKNDPYSPIAETMLICSMKK